MIGVGVGGLVLMWCVLVCFLVWLVCVCCIVIYGGRKMIEGFMVG